MNTSVVIVEKILNALSLAMINLIALHVTAKT